MTYVLLSPCCRWGNGDSSIVLHFGELTESCALAPSPLTSPCSIWAPSLLTVPTEGPCLSSLYYCPSCPICSSSLFRLIQDLLRPTLPSNAFPSRCQETRRCLPEPCPRLAITFVHRSVSITRVIAPGLAVFSLSSPWGFATIPGL